MLSYKCTTDYPVRTGEVQFGLLSSDEIRKMSTVQVKDTTIYYRGLPNPYGINDHRMGTVDRRLLCGTCCKDVRECQGHVGHIELSYPMYHIGFFDMCFKTLRCVCFACSRLLLSAEEKENLGPGDERKTRFQSVYNSVKTRKRCIHCGMTQPVYVRLSISIKCEWPADCEWESPEEQAYCTSTFTQRDALSILTHISKEDASILGFNEFCRPKDMVLTAILVPPPVARPAIMASEGSRSRGQDDLTHKLQDINKRSIELKTFMEEKTWREVEVTLELIERINRLQFEVFTYMNNNIRGQKQSTQRSGAPTKSITDRLRGKDGRIRGNLMGKRVDFSARSVITPDAVMDVDQVGIPFNVAMSLTVPERVTSYNIEALTQRVANGNTHIFGAENVITSTGVMISLAQCANKEKIRLQYGWIVERFLADNDIVIFNRQPSLHKVGMMGHRVKLMPGNTFRLNLCCANPYNADFDGDEMNLHVPQSPAAIADVATIMMVSRQIISPQANRPVMGIVQDSLLGSHLFSCDDILLPRWMACHILAHVRYSPRALPPPCILRPEERWSGKQLLSVLFPSSLRLGSVPDSVDLKDHNRVVVLKGTLVTGVLTKGTLGTSAGGFVDLLYRQYGDAITIRWMSDIQRMVNAWLCIRGFSVGVSDCVLSEAGEKRVKERIETAMQTATELENEPTAGNSEEAGMVESTIVRMLSKCLMQTGGIVDEELGCDNAIQKMVQAGSKGNPINLSQICGCVGQQSVEGRRVFAEKGGRTLSCFHKKDTSLAGRGFVQNSYALGLHPHEYFFHAMGGREGLVDTAVKTATTGYIQRRQMKSMEDHKVCYDGTVRNAEEAIIDFSYGGDGMDPTRVERVHLRCLVETKASLFARMQEWEANAVITMREKILLCKQTPVDARVLLPFSPMRIDLASTGPSAGDAEARSILETGLQKFSSLVMKTAILDFYNTKALKAHALSSADIRDLLDKIGEMDEKARVSYGEMVGSIAAQSIGEPMTQMSASYSTQVVVAVDGRAMSTSIGALINTYLPPVSDPNQHDVMPVSGLTCLGVSPTERVAWASVTHVSRHPANGDMITVRTASGRKLRMTASHSFLVRHDNLVAGRKGSDLAIGDCLPVVKDLPTHGGALPTAPVPLNKETGRLIGAVLSKGTIDQTSVAFDTDVVACGTRILLDFERVTNLKAARRSKEKLNGQVVDPAFAAWMVDHFGRTSLTRTLPAWILDAPDEFVIGMLQTCLDSDAKHTQFCSCYSSVSEQLVTMLCLCLARYGIGTHILSERSKKHERVQRLCVPMCYAAKFEDRVGVGKECGAEGGARKGERMEAREPHIPGMESVLEKVRRLVPAHEEVERVQDGYETTTSTLCRLRERAVQFGIPWDLVAELDQAIHANVWWDPIVGIEVDVDSSEFVYDFTVDKKLQSFMLSNGVFVHNTLNSVDWSTRLVIHWTGDAPPPAPHDEEVGAFIDALIRERKEECEVQPDGETVYLPLPRGTAVALSPDEDGRMAWTELEAVTRHPPINKDGSRTLVEVTTDSGRSVVVTRGKSLLVERGGKLVQVEGDRVRIGDRVPVVRQLPPSRNGDTLNLRTVFSEGGAAFGTSCSFAEDTARLPLHTALDREFGFFLGAYLATGTACDRVLRFPTFDSAFCAEVGAWPGRHGIEAGISGGICFSSPTLFELVVRTCGVGEHKRVPGFAFAAPDDFVRGVCRAYAVCRTHGAAPFASSPLRDGVSLLFARFGVAPSLSAEPCAFLFDEESAARLEQELGSTVVAFELDEPKRGDLMHDVRLEKIVRMENVESSHEFVYDLTVAGTRNMTTTSGFACADTFHLSGVGNKNVTLGIPRLKELLDQTKTIKTPSNTIHFKGDLAYSSEFASYFAATLPLTRLGDIVASCEFVYDADVHTTVVPADAFMVDMNERIGTPATDDCSRFVVRLILNQDVMKTRRITPPMVRSLLRSRLAKRAHVISSETNEVEWIVRIRFHYMRAMMQNLSNDREREGLLCHLVMSAMLDTIAITGHIHVSGAVVGTVEGEKTEYVVETQGCNLIDLSAAVCVDWYSTTSNDVNEVHSTLGLEAAVNVLYTELLATISFDGTYVDPRHIMMIVNTMTRGGYIMPLSRHGINRMDTGPLLRCSFEETPDILCDAACFGERDNGRGVSQNIMTGKLSEIGTGAMHIRVAPHLMHPRDTLKMSTSSTKRVLKSSMRRRDAPTELNNLVEFERIQSTSSLMQIEAPFTSNSAAIDSVKPMHIFSNDMCQAPYMEDECVYQRQEPCLLPSVQHDYRPSTPSFSDMECDM